MSGACFKHQKRQSGRRSSREESRDENRYFREDRLRAFVSRSDTDELIFGYDGKTIAGDRRPYATEHNRLPSAD